MNTTILNNCINVINMNNMSSNANSYPNTISHNPIRKNGMTLEEVNHSRRLIGLSEFTEEEWND